ACAAKDLGIALGVSGVAIAHSDGLKPVDLHFLVVQFADAGAKQRPQVLGIAIELFVIPGDVIHAVRDRRRRMRRRQLLPRPGQLFEATGGSVIEIAGDKDDVRLQSCKSSYYAADETAVSYMA